MYEPGSMIQIYNELKLLSLTDRRKKQQIDFGIQRPRQICQHIDKKI